MGRNGSRVRGYNGSWRRFSGSGPTDKRSLKIYRPLAGRSLQNITHTVLQIWRSLLRNRAKKWRQLPTVRILDWLDRQEQAAPEGIARSEWEYAVRYARERYERGVEHYRRLFHELGWSGMRHGLDAGSGAGHWATAFALDNERATGIDPNAAFIHIASGAAEVAGLAGRVRHQLGGVEALAFPDGCFDAVWSHGVLMFCDTEDSISEISRVLEPGGQFYCGYSSTGFRLSAIYRRVLACDRKQLQAQIGSYLGIALQREGLARTPWGSLRGATASELAAVCQAFGLRFLRQPGLQDGIGGDGPTDFAGIPATVDLLCVRDGDAQAFRAGLLELSLASDDSRQRHHELVRLGLGKLVYGVLRERGPPPDDLDIRSLYVLAAMRAGCAGEVAGLAGERINPLVCGLLAFDQSEFAKAVAAFQSLAPNHPDRSFLLGAALLQAGAWNEAVGEFEKGRGENHRPVECGLGAMLARIDTADWPELCERMAAVLRLLPGEMGASPIEIDSLADRLLRSEG
jgi:SAM-dependent methyltransferase